MTPRTAQYAHEPLKAFIEHMTALQNLFHLSIDAISVTCVVPRLIDRIRQRSNINWEKHRAHLEAIDKRAEIAKKECENGFPLLHEFTLVGTWGALESVVEDVVVAILSNEPDRLRSEPFSKIRVPLGEFTALDTDDRTRLLLHELQRNLRTDQRQGVTAFELILGTVGLSGDVAPNIRERLWEMQHLRNVIVHRRSRADRAFVAACPKLGTAIGQRISLPSNSLAEYSASVCDYAITIIKRIEERYGSIEDTASTLASPEHGSS